MSMNEHEQEKEVSENTPELIGLVAPVVVFIIAIAGLVAYAAN